MAGYPDVSFPIARKRGAAMTTGRSRGRGQLRTTANRQPAYSDLGLVIVTNCF